MQVAEYKQVARLCDGSVKTAVCLVYYVREIWCLGFREHSLVQKGVYYCSGLQINNE